MTRSLPRRLRGITLIETMVSIAILSMVSAAVWGGFSQTARNKQRVEESLERNHVVQAALTRMAREISMAYVSAQVNPSPSLEVTQTCFIGDDRTRGDRLDFTSFGHRRLYRDAHESDQNEVSYFVTRHPEEDMLVLARREQNRIDDDCQRGGRVEILLEDVEGLEFEYLNPNTGEWQRTWSAVEGEASVTGQPNLLPAQVKITLEVPHPRRRGRTLTYATRAAVPMRFGLNHAIYNP
ncbi:MAG: type II secretion system protein GspJ [Myxococcota bacterium]